MAYIVLLGRMMAMDRQQAVRLPIRTRHVLSGSGACQTTLTVYCFRRGCSLPVERCAACLECAQIVSRGPRPFVACWSSPAETMPDEDGRSAASHAQVAEVMTPTVLCVRPDFSMESVTAVLLERGIGSVPVVDADGRPLGVVSRSDLLRRHDAENTLETEPARGREPAAVEPGLRQVVIARQTVEEVMTPLAFTVAENAPVSLAGALMAYEGVHHLPVVSNLGDVLGMVSAIDVLRWLAGRDGYLVSPRPPAA